MIKWVGIFAAGAAIGAGVVLLLTWDGVEGKRVSVPEAGKISAPATARIAAPVSRAISLAEIQQLPNRFNRFAAMYELLGSADVRAVEDLLEEADALPSEGGSLRSVIYLRYVQLAPRAAVTRIRAEEGDRPAELMHALAAWASVDFDAALGFVETLEPSLQNQAAMYILREDEHFGRPAFEALRHRVDLDADGLQRGQSENGHHIVVAETDGDYLLGVGPMLLWNYQEVPLDAHDDTHIFY